MNKIKLTSKNIEAIYFYITGRRYRYTIASRYGIRERTGVRNTMRKLGIDVVYGNDAPRGGKSGNYFVAVRSAAVDELIKSVYGDIQELYKVEHNWRLKDICDVFEIEYLKGIITRN